ncbi:glycerophosphodiester phosphodiesterase family protein [Anaerobacillus sp. MEB173]|uniref:glycerophosphodiester phosphodiesterase family protein n=1 Tax=Anaerobacillus sp. MEB173 TaxID=3383345 RepID=UPI003F8DB944
MFELIKRSIRDYKFSYMKYLFFALLYMLVTSFLFVPLISFIFNRMLKIIGTGSLLNADVYKLGLSIPGLIGILGIGFIAVVILLVKLGVILIIAQQRYFSRNILLSDALVTTVIQLPKLLGFGFFQYIFLTLFIIPFIDFSVFPALLDFNFTIFLTNQVYESSYTFMFALLVLLILVTILFIRWIFTIHYIFIEEKSIFEAMKWSWKLTKGNKLLIIINLCFLNVVISVAWFVTVTLFSMLSTMSDTIVSTMIEEYLITFSSYFAFLLSLFLIPINIIIITRLFYTFQIQQGIVIEDQLVIHRSDQLTKLENKLSAFVTNRKTLFNFVILIIVFLLLIGNSSLNQNIVYLKWNVQVAAHRGDLHSAPENSISSIKAALEKGVDAVEIDVMLTSDGVVVLNHDHTLQRVAGVPARVRDMTYKEVAKLDISSPFSDEFIGEYIPTLEEVLNIIKEENVLLIVDLKPVDDPNGELAIKVVDLIEKYEMEEHIYIQAFEYDLLQEVRKRNNTIKIGQILYLSAGNLSELDVDFYTIRQTMLSERFINNARKQNREVWVWTVNLERNIKEVLKYDIHGIIYYY